MMHQEQPFDLSASKQASEPTVVLSSIQTEQIKELLHAQFKPDSSPLIHILSLFNYFYTNISDQKQNIQKTTDAKKIIHIIHEKLAK